MKLLLFIVFMCYVNCDDGNNYYVIEIPENDPMPEYKKQLKVYWNVPTMQCKSKGIPFDNLYEKYGIIQNENDSFRGEKITILYDPGFFPAIFKNESSGKYRFRNGGVPQEGNLEEHLKMFRKDIEQIIPDKSFDGVGIIDFESWRPVFRQNFGTLVPYKDVSYEIERKLHPWWPKSWVQSEAKRRFEEYARKFMQTTISIAKQMRPRAQWGYYGFPLCFNMAKNHMAESCASEAYKENDQIYWLWSESTALLPSVYRAHDVSPAQLAAMVRGRVREAARVRGGRSEILPYFWFRYRDGGYINEVDLSAVLKALYNSDASGFIIWGSSNDVNTVDKCNNLLNYINSKFGPAVAQYAKKVSAYNDDITSQPDIYQPSTFPSDITSTDKSVFNDSIESTTTKAQIDPEYDWIPPKNYIVDISRDVDELMKKGINQNDETTEKTSFNESYILGLILNSLPITKYVKDDNSKTTTRIVRNDQNIYDTSTHSIQEFQTKSQTDVTTNAVTSTDVSNSNATYSTIWYDDSSETDIVDDLNNSTNTENYNSVTTVTTITNIESLIIESIYGDISTMSEDIVINEDLFKVANITSFDNRTHKYVFHNDNITDKSIEDKESFLFLDNSTNKIDKISDRSDSSTIVDFTTERLEVKALRANADVSTDPPDVKREKYSASYKDGFHNDTNTYKSIEDSESFIFLDNSTNKTDNNSNRSDISTIVDYTTEQLEVKALSANADVTTDLPDVKREKYSASTYIPTYNMDSAYPTTNIDQVISYIYYP